MPINAPAGAIVAILKSLAPHDGAGPIIIAIAARPVAPAKWSIAIETDSGPALYDVTLRCTGDWRVEVV